MEENKLKTIEGELEAPADFTSPDVLYRDLVASIRKYHPSDDLSMIEKAYQLADNAHKDQKRKSLKYLPKGKAVLTGSAVPSENALITFFFYQ